MSERLEHEENLPVMRLGLGSSEFAATPENSHLFTFMGRLAMYNHIFLVTDETDGTLSGTYLFNRIHIPDEMFNELGTFMVENGYHADLNKREVPDCDVNAFNANLELQTGDLDTIPEDWE